MISIIIPAHNEETVIERCLQSLTEREIEGGLEIIVVCNGCRDRTFELAATFGPPVVALRIERASKFAALNHGDAVARGFPRIYLDADIEVRLETIEKVAALLRGEGVLAAGPRMLPNTCGASALVKAFYDIWLRQPIHAEGMVGAGLYAVSEAGRGRFAHFPDIIADDEYVRSLFDDGERATADGCFVTIHAPRTFADLIRIKTRSRLGLYQLRDRFPELAAKRRRKSSTWRRDVIRQPRLWPAALVYLAVNVITRFRARRQFGRLADYRWERDESTRTQANARAG
jgi:glycosyltransferase involved in cell wall biosynthesis